MSVTNYLTERRLGTLTTAIKTWVLSTIIDVESQVEKCLSDPVSVDIDTSTKQLTKTFTNGTMTASFVKSSGTTTVTEIIVPSSGNYNYRRVTTITTVNGVKQVRTTLTPVVKS